MNYILSLINKRRVDYRSIFKQSLKQIRCSEFRRFGIIIPVRGRKGFLPVLLRSFNQCQYLDSYITVVEHAGESLHKDTCESYGINYINIPASGKVFNKCLAFNVGVLLSANADYYIFRDLDCLVQKSFFNNLDFIIKENNAELIQTFKDRRPLYCNEFLTTQLLEGLIDVNELFITYAGVIFDPRNIGAPGGSILSSRKLFFKVGGYDPELFWSYSPEDAFFLHKLQFYAPFYSCQANEVFHLHHPSSVNSNPDLLSLIKIMDTFKKLPFAQKKNIIEYKSKLLTDVIK